ncbi:MAG: spore germination protein [Aminipila sp.]
MYENNHWATLLKNALPVGESFDVLERHTKIGDRDAVMFFVDGLVNGEVMPIVMSYLLQVSPDNTKSISDAKEFMKINLPFLDALTESSLDTALKHVFAGLVALAVEGISDVIIIDIRSYPNRGIDEPTKEKSLRGAKDGFVETFMTNIALIRRRIRDPHLIFKAHIIGKSSKTDVSLVYLKGKADEKIVNQISKKLDEISLDAVSIGDQTIVEQIVMESHKKKGFLGWLNPFPKVRYTQRPDVAAAHISEGKIAIIVDTSPTVLLLPTGIFDFLQDVDDYYFPAITGNYFRALRILNFFVILFLTPIFLLLAEGYIPSYKLLDFFLPNEQYAIPLFWQFILIEIAVDGLKLASLNTPDSLGMSLSVIGALILGELSISSGWFIPQTILCMAVVSLASFTQPSIELGYAIKFMRILLLIGISIGGFFGPIYALIGGIIALIIDFIGVSTTKTIIGSSYLYPLLPFDKKAMEHLIFRTRE